MSKGIAISARYSRRRARMAGKERFIYDDDGQPLSVGSLVLVNGREERVIHLEGGEICIHGWPDDEMIFSVESLADPQRCSWPDAFEEA